MRFLSFALLHESHINSPLLFSFPLYPALLDDLDKELNNYTMRLREWYGWHFPELNKIVSDNLTYARTVKALGTSGLHTIILTIFMHMH